MEQEQEQNSTAVVIEECEVAMTDNYIIIDIGDRALAFRLTNKQQSYLKKRLELNEILDRARELKY